MHTNTIDHDQLERIEAADGTNDDDGDDDRFHGRTVLPGHAIPTTVDPHAVLRDINPGDTITAAAYDDATLDALLMPVDEGGSVGMETRDNRQSTLGFAVGTNIDQ